MKVSTILHYLGASKRVLKEQGWSVLCGKATNKIGNKIGFKRSAPVISHNGEGELFDHLFSTAKNQKSEHYKPFISHEKTESPVELIAFYLPQFHPFPENDEWWGKGFTEWSNVTKASPQFKGHYQPRLPSDLGFYDLRNTSEVMKEQAKLVSNYGLKGLCFHHYWFDGKRLMETPVDNLLKDKSIELDFCLCWANENWTRRWDGAENDVLIAQSHSAEDDLAFIKDISQYMKDSRYIRVNGKPLLIVYRVTLLPDPKATVKRWRDYCKKAGLGDLYLVVAQSFGITSPEQYGFDAAVEFPPHGIKHTPNSTHEFEFYNKNYEGCVFKYSDVVNSSDKYEVEDYELHRTVFPAWDNEARKPGKGHVFHGSTPELYKKWLSNAMRYSANNNENKLVFINAWNEWAEGAYLEPDRRFGYGYLEATHTVLESASEKAGVSVLLPVYNHEKFVYQAIESVAKQTHRNLELVIVDDGSQDNSVAEIKRAMIDFGQDLDIKFIRSSNQGSQKAIDLAFYNSSKPMISLLNSDDKYIDQRLEKCIASLIENNSDLVFSDVKFITEDDTDVTPNHGEHYKAAIQRLNSGNFFGALKCFNLAFTTGNMFMRRELYLKLGGFRDFKLCHDWDFLLRAANEMKVTKVDIPLYEYRYHSNNTFSRLDDEVAINETREILSQFPS